MAATRAKTGKSLSDPFWLQFYRTEGARPRSPVSRFWLGVIGHTVSENGFDIVEHSTAPVMDTAGMKTGIDFSRPAGSLIRCRNGGN